MFWPIFPQFFHYLPDIVSLISELKEGTFSLTTLISMTGD